MKKIKWVLLSIIAVFLVCDPQAGVEFYNVVENGTTTKVTAQADGSIKMDLSGVAEGDHSFQVAACNMWGCSENVPFVFKKTIPSAIANSRLMAGE